MTTNRKANFKFSKMTKTSPLATNALKPPPIVTNPAFKDQKSIELNEEWSNFMQRVGQVSNLVKDLASGDKQRADAAHKLADQYLEGKVILDEEVEMKVKDNRTVINKKAFKSFDNKDSGEIGKEVWMAEISKDAEQRAADRKVRQEKAETQKTMAVKAFRRGEYERALSCYNKAIDFIRDNSMYYCDRALTYIKLGKYDKVDHDCDLALRLNEESYKARLYRTKAHKELGSDQFEEHRQELREMFLKHEHLTEYFLNKKEDDLEKEGEED